MPKQFHDQEGGIGYALGSMLVHQILRAGFYWPTIFRDAHDYAKRCHICQTAAGKEKNSNLPLQPVLELKPFAKWGLDFIGVINPNSSRGHKFILIATNYCTRWAKAKVCKNATLEVVKDFPEELIITRFII